MEESSGDYQLLSEIDIKQEEIDGIPLVASLEGHEKVVKKDLKLLMELKPGKRRNSELETEEGIDGIKCRRKEIKAEKNCEKTVRKTESIKNLFNGQIHIKEEKPLDLEDVAEEPPKIIQAPPKITIMPQKYFVNLRMGNLQKCLVPKPPEKGLARLDQF